MLTEGFSTSCLNRRVWMRNVCQSTVVTDAWQRGQSVVVHGWVYGLHNGLLQDLKITAAAVDEVNASYDRALARLEARWLDNNTPETA